MRDEEEGKERMLEVGVVIGVAAELEVVVFVVIVKDEGAVWRWRRRVRRVRKGWGISEAGGDVGPGWG